MTSVLTKVLDRIDVVLKASMPGVNIFRDRADALSREEAPAVNVLSREGQSEPAASDLDIHTVAIEFRFAVREEPPTPAVEALHAAAHAALLTDVTLKALIDSMRLTDYSFESAEADVTSAIKSARYRLIYSISPSII